MQIMQREPMQLHFAVSDRAAMKKRNVTEKIQKLLSSEIVNY